MKTKKLKIQVGIKNIEDFYYFLPKADEFYFGLQKVHSHIYYTTTFTDLNQLKKIINTTKKYRKKIFFTINEITENIIYILKTVKKLIDLGIDGLIIRDISLLNYLKEKNIDTMYILSTLSLCFNRDALKFYNLAGIKRLVLPEQITPKEAKYLIQNPYNIETEVFITSKEYCIVLNGFCYLRRINNTCLCRKKLFMNNYKIFKMPNFSPYIHLSNFYHFIKQGANIIKIGRHPDDFYSKIIFNEAIAIKEILETTSTFKEFIQKAIKIDLSVAKFLERGKEKYKHIYEKICKGQH